MKFLLLLLVLTFSQSGSALEAEPNWTGTYDTTLSELDRELGGLVQNRKEDKSKEANALVMKQRSWLKLCDSDCGSDTSNLRSCLKIKYETRLKELRS